MTSSRSMSPPAEAAAPRAPVPVPGDAAEWDQLIRATAGDPLHSSTALAVEDPLAAGREGGVVVRGDRGQAIAAAVLRTQMRRGLAYVINRVPVHNRFTPGLAWSGPDGRDALAAGLLGHDGDILQLGEVPEDCGIVRALRRLRPDIHVVPDSVAWICEMAGRAPVSNRERSDLRRAARRAADAGTPIETGYLTSAGAIARALPDALGLLGRARFEDADPDPYIRDRAGLAYIGELTMALAREGHERMIVLSVGGRPAAFATAHVWGDVAVGHRMAFDRDLDHVPSLGRLAMIEMMDRLAGEGVRRMHLGAGGDRTKSRWCRPQRTCALSLGLSRRGRLAMRASAVRRGARRRLHDLRARSA
jgi:CelD/BcsL family acetyltransferase involved in cellulose biosynthesis